MLDYITGSLGTLLLAALGWTFQLNSRVSVLEQQHIDLKELINTRFDNSDSRLDRIERGMNGKLPKE